MKIFEDKNSRGMVIRRTAVVDHNGKGYSFNVTSGMYPTLPLLYTSHFNVPAMWGSDTIPIVIDSAHRCWMEGELTSREDIEASLEYEHRLDMIGEMRNVLRMKPCMPSEARWALDNGWTPPATFNVDDYE